MQEPIDGGGSRNVMQRRLSRMQGEQRSSSQNSGDGSNMDDDE